MVCLSPCLCYCFDFVSCHGEYHQRGTKKEIPACVARRHVSNLQLLDVQGTGLLRAFVQQCPGSAGLSNPKHSGLLSARCPSHWTRPGLRPPIGASPGSTGRLCRRKTNLTLARDNTRLLYSHVFVNVLVIVFVFVFVFVFNTKQT